MATIEIYTDGSCDAAYHIGGWAAIILLGEEEITLTGYEQDTTHQRMELTAVIKSLNYLRDSKLRVSHVNLYSDSQYVINLPERKEKILAARFLTNKNEVMRNADLIEALLTAMESYPVHFIKVEAHQKKTLSKNYNREVDKLCRKIVREQVRPLKMA